MEKYQYNKPEKQSISSLKAQIEADSILQILLIVGKIPGHLPILSGFGWLEYKQTADYTTQITNIIKNQHKNEKNLGKK